MKRIEKQHRLSLTLLFTGVVLCHILVTVLIVGLALYILIRSGFWSKPDDMLSFAAKVIVIFMIASLPVGGVMTFLVGKLLLKPINTLINRINCLATGDYKARIYPGPPWDRHPSIHELSESFNRMAAELENTEMLRSDFINNFSHEFKTPIVSIAGFAKLLRHGNVPPAQQAEYLEIIEAESLRLSQMATNVLNLTKVENQTVLTDTRAYNLSEQIRSCILLLSSKWEKKELTFLPDFGEYTVTANEELLKQVWINLLDNAIKFSPREGTIEVTVSQKAGHLWVSVINFGPTIPPEKQQKIFRKFYQADESHASEGNGVGLAIVKRVVELHKGAVTVNSAEGATCFTVTLPQ